MLHLSAIYLPIYGMNYQIGLFSRVHPNTHSNTIVVRNGFAWAVRIATHELTLCSQEHHDRLFLVMELTNFLESKTFMKPH